MKKKKLTKKKKIWKANTDIFPGIVLSRAHAWVHFMIYDVDFYVVLKYFVWFVRIFCYRMQRNICEQLHYIGWINIREQTCHICCTFGRIIRVSLRVLSDKRGITSANKQYDWHNRTWLDRHSSLNITHIRK